MAMNLQCTPSPMRNHQISLDGNVLNDLRACTASWGTQIAEFVVREGIHRAIDSIGSRLKVNDRLLTSYFSNKGFSKLIVVLKQLMTIDRQEASEVLEDTIGILCLMAAISSDFKQWIIGDNAENSWHQLLEDARLLRNRAVSTYRKHQEIYDAVLTIIKQLLPPTIRFCVEVAAAIFSAIWPYRHAIAEWITANWKVATGAIVGAVVVGGLLALGAYGLYKAFSADNQESDSD